MWYVLKNINHKWGWRTRKIWKKWEIVQIKILIFIIELYVVPYSQDLKEQHVNNFKIGWKAARRLEEDRKTEQNLRPLRHESTYFSWIYSTL